MSSVIYETLIHLNLDIPMSKVIVSYLTHKVIELGLQSIVTIAVESAELANTGFFSQASFKVWMPSSIPAVVT